MNDQKFKADAGKSDPTLFDEGFPNAVDFIQATLDYGAIKYEAHSWRTVPDAFKRYNKAAGRHRKARMKAQQRFGTAGGFLHDDAESGLPHIAHELFNLMAQIELYIADRPGTDFSKVLQFKHPPTAHKQPPAATMHARIEDATRKGYFGQ